jgi:hypothetical protein
MPAGAHKMQRMALTSLEDITKMAINFSLTLYEQQATKPVFHT